jgi:DNA-binding beta-propeller fold protein YncE
MKTIAHAIFCLSVAALPASFALAQTPAATPGYHVSQTFHIGGDGAWDYLTVDPDHKLLYVPRTTHTMVLDATTGKTVADIPGQKRNHGVAIVPSAGRGFITDGSDASVTVFDLKTYAVLGKVKTAPDSDGVIYDPASDKVLVVCGDAGVLIPISPNIDPATGTADAPVDLGGKPEFLAADGQGRAYINLVDKDQVAVVDTKTMKVLRACFQMIRGCGF